MSGPKGWAGKGSTRQWRQVRAAILARDGHRCTVRVSPRCNGRGECVDHILPRAYGGSDHPANLRASCNPCNLRLAALMTNQPAIDTPSGAW